MQLHGQTERVGLTTSVLREEHDVFPGRSRTSSAVAPTWRRWVWSDATLDTEELEHLVKRAKGAHQAPEDVIPVHALPMTLVGEIDKRQLRALDLPRATPTGDTADCSS